MIGNAVRRPAKRNGKAVCTCRCDAAAAKDHAAASGWRRIRGAVSRVERNHAERSAHHATLVDGWTDEGNVSEHRGGDCGYRTAIAADGQHRIGIERLVANAAKAVKRQSDADHQHRRGPAERIELRRPDRQIATRGQRAGGEADITGALQCDVSKSHRIDDVGPTHVGAVGGRRRRNDAAAAVIERAAALMTVDTETEGATDVDQICGNHKIAVAAPQARTLDVVEAGVVAELVGLVLNPAVQPDIGSCQHDIDVGRTVGHGQDAAGQRQAAAHGQIDVALEYEQVGGA